MKLYADMKGCVIIKNCVLYLLLLSYCCLSCKKSGGDDTGNNVPTVSLKISDVTLNRQSTDFVFRFFVNLSSKTSKQVTVQYATIDGTAVAGKDYTKATGTLTFEPDDTELYIDITVKGDSLRQSEQQFFVQLNNAQNATLTVPKATGTIINDGTYLPTGNTGYTASATYAGYKLVWSDEFNERTLNTDNWNYETGGGGWGNNELEFYTPRLQNVFLSSGNLVIEARKEAYNGAAYTSARLNTAGKRVFQYGRIDIRAKLPVAQGMWPALWMLGSNFSSTGWPACGETDIMELIGKNPAQVVGSFHWKKGDGSVGTVNDTYNLGPEDFSKQFHVFSLIWSAESLQILVDDKVYVTGTKENITTGTYPFDAPSFFIFNVAVGGDWPGPPGEATIFPQHMFVDYVRVFQKQ